MAYNYNPAYKKRREKAIKARRELNKMGIPSSALPKLPKSASNVSKKQAKEMTEYLSTITTLVKAEKYVKKHPTVTRQEAILIEERKLAQKRKSNRQYEARKRAEKRGYENYKKQQNIKNEFVNNSLYEVIESNFTERLQSIPIITTKRGKSYNGRDIILKWWYGVKRMLTSEQLGRLIDGASQEGIIIEVRELYEEEIATRFIKQMMDYLKDSNILDNEEYEGLTDELEYINEKGFDYED